MLWTSAKGRRLLDKINEETGLVFDKENYELIKRMRWMALSLDILPPSSPRVCTLDLW
jgi:hypothetical protein